MTEALTYKIDTFEGPLDLLLSLIAKNKMEIADIRITVIFEQYMAYLEQMKQMDMEIAGEFIVMASELMLIKSRMLLPKVEEEEEDPRARLAAALLEYKKAKEASLYLEGRYAEYSRRFVKDTDEISSDPRDISPHDTVLLQRALLRLFSKKDRESVPPMGGIDPIIHRVIVPVSEKIRGVMTHLAREGCTPFLALFEEATSKSEVVAIFMAVLALIKDGHILLEKRVSAARRDGQDPIEDDTTDYDYEFYCSLDPEAQVPEDYAGYDEFE